MLYCSYASVHAVSNFSSWGLIQVFCTYSKNKGHAKQAHSNRSTHLGNAPQSQQSITLARASITTSHASLGWTSILHLAFTLLFMCNLHSKLQASIKTSLIVFIRARSLSLTITSGYTSPLKNNPRNLCKSQMKLFSRSLDIRIKAAEKVKPVHTYYFK